VPRQKFRLFCLRSGRPCVGASKYAWMCSWHFISVVHFVHCRCLFSIGGNAWCRRCSGKLSL